MGKYLKITGYAEQQVSFTKRNQVVSMQLEI